LCVKWHVVSQPSTTDFCSLPFHSLPLLPAVFLGALGLLPLPVVLRALAFIVLLVGKSF
jgi:hypothetical protein